MHIEQNTTNQSQDEGSEEMINLMLMQRTLEHKYYVVKLRVDKNLRWLCGLCFGHICEDLFPYFRSVSFGICFLFSG